MNDVYLMGNLTRDPVRKDLQRGGVVVDFSIAINSFGKKDGERVEYTDYFNCEVWGKTAEFVDQYCQKGDKVLIKGSLKQETWEVDGTKRSAVKVRVDNLQKLSGPKRDREESEPVGAGVGQEEVLTNGQDIPF